VNDSSLSSEYQTDVVSVTADVEYSLSIFGVDSFHYLDGTRRPLADSELIAEAAFVHDDVSLSHLLALHQARTGCCLGWQYALLCSAARHSCQPADGRTTDTRISTEY